MDNVEGDFTEKEVEFKKKIQDGPYNRCLYKRSVI